MKSRLGPHRPETVTSDPSECSCTGIHDAYYLTYQQKYEQMNLDDADGALAAATAILGQLTTSCETLQNDNVPGTQYLDYLVPLLGSACNQFVALLASQLPSTDDAMGKNKRTLSDLKTVKGA